MEYHNDIFYDVQDRSYDEKVEILNWCKERCYKWVPNVLDGLRRRHVEISWDEIMGKFNAGSHFVFIHRRGYESWRNMENHWCIEAGFRTMDSPDYFLFIWVPEDALEEAVDKFKLTKL